MSGLHFREGTMNRFLEVNWGTPRKCFEVRKMRRCSNVMTFLDINGGFVLVG